MKIGIIGFGNMGFSHAQQLSYIERAAGSLFEPVRARAFLNAAPRMLAFVEEAGGSAVGADGPCAVVKMPRALVAEKNLERIEKARHAFDTRG